MLRELLQAPWTIRAAVLVTAAALSISVVTDLRRRVILNWVTVPALAVVIALFGISGGWPLVKNSLIGIAVCAVPMLLAALPGWIGIVDVKRMAGCGSVAGLLAGVRGVLLVAVGVCL